MKIYFLSSLPCALTVNGAYFGITDLFSRHAEVSLKDNLFLTFTPENAHPISFFLNERIRAHAPERTRVYLGDDFIALYAFDFAPFSTAFTIHAQEIFGDICVSVFSQGETQCVIQTKENAFTSLLPSSFSRCEITKHGEYFFLKSPVHLAVFHQSGKCVFLEEVLDFSIAEREENHEGETAFNATLPLSSALARVMKATFILTENGTRKTACSLLQNEGLNKAQGVAYAFLESLRLGLDASPFLAPNLLSDFEKIKEFLKEFTQVCITQSENEFLLVYPFKARIFTLRKVCVEVEDMQIIDIKG
jgi:hypothetical protein